MKISYEQWKDRLNERLASYKQHIRVVDFGKLTLLLSTGDTLTQPEFGKFKRRVMNIKTNLWVKNMDSLLAGTVTETQIKSMLAATGGKAVHKLHPNLSKKNLNTGIPWNKGTVGLQTGWAKGLTKETDSRIAKFAKFGGKNGMHGVKMSDSDKQIRSDIMKTKILSGEFTPNSNNRNTHWDSEYDGKKYRSSWEALYQSMHPKAEYEALRIEYSINGCRKIYIVDFVDYTTKLVSEVKPAELCKGEIFEAKMSALNNWANQNDFNIILATQEWLLNQDSPSDLSKFDKKTATKIRKLYEISKKN
jgi:hypothetical protein